MPRAKIPRRIQSIQHSSTFIRSTYRRCKRKRLAVLLERNLLPRQHLIMQSPPELDCLEIPYIRPQAIVVFLGAAESTQVVLKYSIGIPTALMGSSMYQLPCQLLEK